MTHPHAKPEASTRDLMNKGRGLSKIIRMAGVHIGNAGPERNLVGGKGQGLAQANTVANTLTVNAAEAFLLDLGCHFQGLFSSSSNGD